MLRTGICPYRAFNLIVSDGATYSLLLSDEKYRWLLRSGTVSALMGGVHGIIDDKVDAINIK